MIFLIMFQCLFVSAVVLARRQAPSVALTLHAFCWKGVYLTGKACGRVRWCPGLSSSPKLWSVPINLTLKLSPSRPSPSSPLGALFCISPDLPLQKFVTGDSIREAVLVGRSLLGTSCNGQDLSL